MRLKTVADILFAVGSAFAVAWAAGVVTVGRGFISTYLAPLAFVPLMGSVLLRLWLEQPRVTKGVDQEGKP